MVSCHKGFDELVMIVFRESNHSIIDRRKHTLGIIKMLQSQILTGKEAEEFYLVLNR